MSEWSASSSRVDAILFDLGNTLVSYYRSADFAPVLERCITAAAEILRERPDLGTADTAAAYRRALAANVERADHRVRPLRERLLEVFGLDARRVPAELLERLGDAFLGPIFATARLDAAAIDVLSHINQLGIKTAIVSNTPWGSAAGAWRAELARHGLLERIDATVFCVDVGWRKPAPHAFARALELLDVAAEHAWFVGDDPVWDVAGARAAGVRPILVGPGPGAERCEQISTLADVVLLINKNKTLDDLPRSL